jgi:hypothetical protein
MANLENPAGTPVDAAKAATAGDYLHFNRPDRAGAAQVPGKTGPFANFLFPGMGDAARFGAFPVRNSTGDVENQLGVYDPQGRGFNRKHSGPIGDSGVVGGLEGYTQRLNLAALVSQAKIHEKMILQYPRFWINAIKSERFAPHAGWEQKIEVFRGGHMPQSGLSRWRRLLPVPEANFNNPSNFPGYETYETTTEEYVGTGYETGWGSEVIDIDYLRNIPNAAQKVKEYLEFGVTEGLQIREIWNRETYIHLACAAHKAFVMATDCECVEDGGSRVFLYDPHIAIDAFAVSTTSTDANYYGNFGGTDVVGGKDMFGQTINNGDICALVDDRRYADADEKVLCKLTNMCDVYGQYHAIASKVTDPKTGSANPFLIVDMGPAGKVLPIERPNFDMLERLTDMLEKICPEQAVTQEDGVPVFGITVKPDDVNKLAKANPAEWRAYLEARPEDLLSYYGVVKGKTYRRWSIVNDTNQMRFKPIRYIATYNQAAAADYGMLGFRPGDDTQIQGRAVCVCVCVDPMILSKTRRGTNGVAVEVPNPEYSRAPLAIASVYLRDTFVNQLEGAPEGVGNGTEFGPFPIFNGSWGFLNIRDRKTNPFGTKGNFYGIFRNHVMPTKYTREACAFIYARDTVAFEAYFQSQNRVINPDYTGAVQSVAVLGVGACPSIDELAKTAAAATKIAAGQAFTIDLSTTPHVKLGVGNTAKLGGEIDVSGTATNIATPAEVVVLDDTMWPRVVLAPTSDLTLATFGLKDAGNGSTTDHKLEALAGTKLTLAAK